MNPEVKALWIADLRSGKHLQITGALHLVSLTEGFCCLGRLCEIAIEQGVNVTTSIDPAGSVIKYDNFAGVLPEIVVDWAGLDSDTVVLQLPAYTPIGSLISANDDGFTFEQIADIIEWAL